MHSLYLDQVFLVITIVFFVTIILILRSDRGLVQSVLVFFAVGTHLAASPYLLQAV